MIRLLFFSCFACLFFSCQDTKDSSNNQQADNLEVFEFPKGWDILPQKAQSGDWEIRWSDKKALAVNETAKEIKVIFEDFTKEEELDGFKTTHSEDGTVRSVVGPYVSFQRDIYYEGGAHPSGGSNYLTYDIRKENILEKVNLKELFNEETLYRALMKDKVVQKILKEANASPKTFEELAQVDGGCLYDLGDIRYSYAFHHLNNGKVAVRLGLGHGCEAARFTFNQLGLYMDIPSELKADITNANNNKTLMDYLDRPE